MHPAEIIAERLQSLMADLGYTRTAPFSDQAPNSIKNTWFARYENGKFEFRIYWPALSQDATVTIRCLIRSYDFSLGVPIVITLRDVSNPRNIRAIKEQIRDYLLDEIYIFEKFEEIKKLKSSN